MSRRSCNVFGNHSTRGTAGRFWCIICDRSKSGRLDSLVKRSRIGWLGDWGGSLPFEDGVLSQCKRSLDLFESKGDVTIECLPAPFPNDALWEAWMAIRSHTILNSLQENIPPSSAKETGVDNVITTLKKRGVKPEAIWECEQGKGVTRRELERAIGTVHNWSVCVEKLFQFWLFGSAFFPGVPIRCLSWLAKVNTEFDSWEENGYLSPLDGGNGTSDTPWFALCHHSCRCGISWPSHWNPDICFERTRCKVTQIGSLVLQKCRFGLSRFSCVTSIFSWEVASTLWFVLSMYNYFTKSRAPFQHGICMQLCIKCMKFTRISGCTFHCLSTD